MTEAKKSGKMVYMLLGVAAACLVAFLAGRFSVGRSDSHDGHETPGESHEAKASTVWTCSMHPQFKLPKKGQCPTCFMDLIPLEAGAGDEGPRELTISESAATLMEIETREVERRFVTSSVRMVGKIAYDETRVSDITAWVPGRLDRLFVDYTGVPVRQGDHMVEIYSPELLTAQEELLQAVKASKALEASDVSVLRETTAATVEAAREKLRLWGLTPEQIKQIEQKGKPSDHVTLYAPSGGIVIHKHAQEGMYVNTGTRIYTIADLSHAWVNLDAFESDLRWLKYGQEVTFTTESYPGEAFTGTISFIHPVLNEPTRTVKVRVNVANEDGRLKPGMFVRAMAKATIATEGRILDTVLAGKWISPMHPEIVKDQPGFCDVCGMPLVRAESLGYVGAEPSEADKPLVIPASAPLLTGKRAVVYVALPDKDKPTYEGREILLGPRADHFYVVARGLEAGERVVTKGAFKLDAELQIRAKPSMMSMSGDDPSEPTTDTPKTTKVSPEFKQQLKGVIDGYLKVQTSLAADSLETTVEAARKTAAAISAVTAKLGSRSEQARWEKAAGELKSVVAQVGEATDIEAARAKFFLLSQQVSAAIERYGVPGAPLYRAWCPMAFDYQGAGWIQSDELINNPYFGATMLRCGEIKEVLK